jgi:hypothetical protein
LRRAFLRFRSVVDIATPAPAAPVAPAAAPATITATRDAANRGDFSAFDTAATASRRGAPLPTVDVKADAPAAPVAPVAPVTPAEPPAAPTTDQPAEPKNRRVSQDYINNTIRTAVDAATAPLRDEIARLRGGQPAAPVEPAAPPAPATPEWKTYATHPDAPKLEDFDSIGEHTAAMAMFIVDQRERSRAEASQQTQRQQQLQQEAESFVTKMQEAGAADPDYLSKMPPAILNTERLSALPKGTEPTFANVVVEAAFRASAPAALLQHLHAHQDEAIRIARMGNTSAMLVELARLDGRLSAGASGAPAPPPSARPAAPARPTPSPISAAQPPAPTLTSPGTSADPKSAALARGDFAAFDRLDTQDRIARRRSA